MYSVKAIWCKPGSNGTEQTGNCSPSTSERDEKLGHFQSHALYNNLKQIMIS